MSPDPNRQLAAPDEEFVKLVGRQIHEGSLTKAVIEQLKPAIQGALDIVIRNRIQDKLNIAFRPEASAPDAGSQKEADGKSAALETVTTDEELQGFMIVRAIGARVIDIDRITIRDAKSYCSIFVDDNNRKPVCRLYFNAKSTKSIGLFDSQKAETKHTIDRLSDIFKFASKIEDCLKGYVQAT